MFTSVASSGGLLRALVNQCAVSQAFDPSGGGSAPSRVEFNAIWDTGATNSVITQAVVDACKLVPTGLTRVSTASGPTLAETFLVNIYLPSQVGFAAVRVTKGDFLGGDILIGMDIICNGDFAVTNHGGLTKFTFRVPSLAHIDFVDEHNKAFPPQGAGQPSRAERRRLEREKR